ncbi:MAG: Asp-tRNA(Asn)/Glu-tRNA(Gln) amidotransferase subunit GatC [Candidatus Moraniibacteriota bacterium]
MLTTEEVKHIALLARIGITEDEIEKSQKDLSAVLDFFRELETAVTEGILPIGHITGMTDVARTDRAEDFVVSGQEMIRENFPDAKDGFLKVKSVF